MDESLAELELAKAYETSQNGNEGMARVLARRAAGMAVREYLGSINFDQRGLSLNTLINNEAVRKVTPASIHAALDRLSTRIGMDFNFPMNYDLLMDSRLVIDQLTNIIGEKQ
ncbi:MAG: hypothetical protein CVU42_12830 [Chloroflexi bacterium HGW-Chloroflexi-4]|jgi:hypothetical protein|nr:MAG: hypothetical protein CVU42_12830 [Chloroflexi bacterium HGW-Chloroflexi-4]